jgi:hypothetical protein
MWPFRKRNPHRLLPLHADNALTSDWSVLLEANTIVDGSGRRLRVARITQSRKVVKRFWPRRGRLYVEVDDYDPRIHMLVLCPQLYKHDAEGRIVPLRAAEIGAFIARALDRKANLRTPWYSAANPLPAQPIISETLLEDYDTLMVDPLLAPPIAPAALENRKQRKRLEHAAPDR